METELCRVPRGLGSSASEDPHTPRQETLHYLATPRAKRSFNTVLDARNVWGAAPSTSTVTTRLFNGNGSGAPSAMDLRVFHQLAGGRLVEQLRCAVGEGLRAQRFERQLLTEDGTVCRENRADFRAGAIGLPEATYPEVLMPFMLRGQDFDGKVHSLYAWVTDRFVAKMYYERRKGTDVQVPAGRFETHECWLYPDLNDWVRVGSLLTKLAKPFLPRYQLWYEQDPPHRLVRFEGPYGPPGAPEIVLELRGEG